MKNPPDPASALDQRAQDMRDEAQGHRKQAEVYQTQATNLFEQANLLDAAAEGYDAVVKQLRGSTITGENIRTNSLGDILAAALAGVDPSRIQVIR